MVVLFSTPICKESWSCSMFFQAFGVLSVWDFSHYNRRVVAYFYFNLQFPITCCGASFCMFICQLYSPYWWSVCSDVLPIFFNRAVFSYCWVFRVLHVFWIWALYQIYIYKDFSLSYLSILLTMSFAERQLFVLKKPSLPVLPLTDHAFGIVSKKLRPTQRSLRFSRVTF